MDSVCSTVSAPKGPLCVVVTVIVHTSHEMAAIWQSEEPVCGSVPLACKGALGVCPQAGSPRSGPGRAENLVRVPWGVAEECNGGCDSWDEGSRKTKLLDRAASARECGLGRGDQRGKGEVNIQGQS